MTITRKFAAVLLAATMLATQANAAEFCYARRYDNAHMAQHPDQLVTSLLLYLNDKTPSGSPDYPPNASWKLVVTRRGDKHLLVQTASYGKDGHGGYTASVDCDGGSFNFTLIPGGIHMSIEYTLRMAVMNDPCGEGREAVTQSTTIGGGDDSSFILEQVPLQVCTMVMGRIDWESIPPE